MQLPFAVDLISDLNLSSTDDFDWTGQPTSLFCVVAGNISNDLEKVYSVLKHLGSLYRGVFYIDGNLENDEIYSYDDTVDDIREACKKIINVVYLHSHVVILNNIAFVAINGWLDKHRNVQDINSEAEVDDYRIEDISYLSMTIKTLQHHNDVNKIVVISSSVPSNFLTCLSDTPSDDDKVEPVVALVGDLQGLVTTWMFGSGKISVDHVIEGCRYINNHREVGQPYWPKRIEF